MKLITAVLSALILLVATSCDLQKIRTQKCQKWGICTSKDSVIIKDSIAFDTTYLDNSEFWSSILFACDSNGNVMIKQIDSLKSKNIDLQLALKDNKLIQYIRVPAQTVKVPVYFHSQSKVKTVTVKVNELKWHQAARLWAFNIILIVAILLFGWKMLKLYIYKKLP
jgi:hypothetical protein